MFNNYLKIAFRHFQKQKNFSQINMIGLTIGITCCLLIGMYVADELSYDRHFARSSQIYRVAAKTRLGSQDLDEAVTPDILAETLVREFPEVLRSTHFAHTPNLLVRFQDKVLNETDFLWVDSTFFQVFQARMLYGNPATALKEHHTVVMTQETARKYFDNLADAVGAIVYFEDGTPYRLTGIVEDLPENTHFHYHMIATLSSWGDRDRGPGSWLMHSMYTYLVLHPGSKGEDLEAKFPAFIQKYVGPPFEKVAKMSLDQFFQSGGNLEYFLQPITQIHLHSHVSRELEPNSDMKYVTLFSIIAFFILAIACINYMNLSTARSLGRSREVGLRKVLGSSKPQLVGRFFLESMLYAALASCLAVLLAQCLIPGFNALTGKQLALNLFGNWHLIPIISVLVLMIGLLAGSYPAFYLASFRPIFILRKSNSRGTSGNPKMRSLLVVIQFIISIILIIGTYVVYQQLQFIQNKRLGFEKENIIVIKRGWAIGQNPDGSDQPPVQGRSVFEAFKSELLQNPQIVSVAGARYLPGKDCSERVIKPEGASDNDRIQCNYLGGGYDYARTLKFEFVEGRPFTREMASDSMGIILNETAAKLITHGEPAVEKRVGFIGDSDVVFHVIGVVKDFHYESLHHAIAPLMIGLRNQSRTYIVVKIQPKDVRATVAFLERTWNRYLPYKPFEYFFYDDTYDSMYRAEQRIGKLFTLFSLLAILIACLGLLGLASFTTEQRTKEIGIRKVLGASVSTIMLKLSFEFIRWILTAILIAWPVAWLAMNAWLENFAYRAELSAVPFLFAALLALAIALLTLSWQMIRAARANPIESLRYE